MGISRISNNSDPGRTIRTLSKSYIDGSQLELLPHFYDGIIQVPADVTIVSGHDGKEYQSRLSHIRNCSRATILHSKRLFQVMGLKLDDQVLFEALEGNRIRLTKINGGNEVGTGRPSVKSKKHKRRVSDEDNLSTSEDEILPVGKRARNQMVKNLSLAEREKAEAVGLAEQLVGSPVLMGPPLCASWEICYITRRVHVPNSQNVLLEVEIEVDSKEARHGRKRLPINLSFSEAKARAEAAAPGALVGARVQKHVQVGDEEVEVSGALEEYETETKMYVVTYSRHAQSDLMTVEQVLHHLARPMPSWKFASAKDQLKKSSQHAKGRKRTKVLSGTAGGGVNSFQPNGAGATRGVTAWDDRAQKMRPVGHWIRDKRSQTASVRADIDFRDFSEGTSLPLRQSNSQPVSGWIGICSEGHIAWNADYSGKYRISIYMHQLGQRMDLLYPALDSVRAAANFYDQVALVLNGPARAELNFPLDDAAKEKMSLQSYGSCPMAVICAIEVLNLEQGMPFEAVAGSHATHQDWEKLRDDLLENYLLRPNTDSAAVAGALGSKLAWVLEQVTEAAMVPKHRGPVLQEFLAECRGCSSLDVDDTEEEGGKRSLYTLINFAWDQLLAKDTFEYLENGASPEKLHEVAMAEQLKLEKKLSLMKKKATPASKNIAPPHLPVAKDINLVPSMAGPARISKRRKTGAATKKVALIKPNSPLLAPWHAISQPPTSLMSPGLRVVVVGAGVAGLKAAADLQAEGAEVIVLEARNRLGGRIHTVSLQSAPQESRQAGPLHGIGSATAEGPSTSAVQPPGALPLSVKVDVGASSVSDVSNQSTLNTLLRCVQGKLGGKEANNQGIVPSLRDGLEGTAWYDATVGCRASLTSHLISEEAYHRAVSALLELAAKTPKDADVSLATAIDKALREMAAAHQGELSPMLEMMVRRRLMDLFAAEPERMSFLGAVSDGEGGVEDEKREFSSHENWLAILKRWHDDNPRKEKPSTREMYFDEVQGGPVQLGPWLQRIKREANGKIGTKTTQQRSRELLDHITDLLQLDDPDWWKVKDHADDRKGKRGNQAGDIDEPEHWAVPGGLSQLVDALNLGLTGGSNALPLEDVRTGAVVERIELERNGVKVFVKGWSEPLQAHAAIVTVPLGVLKDREGITFSPPLPDYKLKALSGLAMGTENRVAMLFDSVFWPENQHFFKSLTHGKYTFANMHAVGVKNVLCCEVRSATAEMMETVPDEVILADVMDTLQGMFKSVVVPRPVAYAITRWGQDPFSRGAYSYVPHGGRKEYHTWLSYPVAWDEGSASSMNSDMSGPSTMTIVPPKFARVPSPNTRLFFAGEATHEARPYTVTAAFESGMREARRIKAWWRAHHEPILSEAVGNPICDENETAGDIRNAKEAVNNAGCEENQTAGDSRNAKEAVNNAGCEENQTAGDSRNANEAVHNAGCEENEAAGDSRNANEAVNNAGCEENEAAETMHHANEAVDNATYVYQVVVHNDSQQPACENTPPE